jgi:hypothetical protein
MTVLEIDELAAHVSRKCQWDGRDILHVMLEALTDANFHTLREQLEATSNAYFEQE